MPLGGVVSLLLTASTASQCCALLLPHRLSNITCPVLPSCDSCDSCEPPTCVRTPASTTHPSTEMRSTVLSPLHHLRRTLDSLLAKLIPSTPTATLSLTSPFPTTTVKGWTSLYEMVTFRPDVGYGEALRRERWQRGVINWASWMTGVGAAAGLGGVGVWAAQRWFKRR